MKNRISTRLASVGKTLATVCLMSLLMLASCTDKTNSEALNLNPEISDGQAIPLSKAKGMTGTVKQLFTNVPLPIGSKFEVVDEYINYELPSGFSIEHESTQDLNSRYILPIIRVSLSCRCWDEGSGYCDPVFVPNGGELWCESMNCSKTCEKIVLVEIGRNIADTTTTNGLFFIKKEIENADGSDLPFITDYETWESMDWLDLDIFDDQNNEANRIYNEIKEAYGVAQSESRSNGPLVYVPLQIEGMKFMGRLSLIKLLEADIEFLYVPNDPDDVEITCDCRTEESGGTCDKKNRGNSDQVSCDSSNCRDNCTMNITGT